MSTTNRILWKVGTPPPKELASNPFLSTLVPRAVAWLSVDDTRVTLMDSYTGASYTPPAVFFGSGVLPKDVLSILKEKRVCTMSAVTLHDPPQSYRQAATNEPQSFLFEELNLKTTKRSKEYPVAVASSPVQMFCSLSQCVELGNGDELIVLDVETFHVKASVLSDPTDLMKAGGRESVAKIDAELIQGIVKVGDGKFARLKELRSMPRPKQQEDGSWTSTDFNRAAPSLGPGNHADMEWSYRIHGGKCPLGYNALTALIQPRLIGWISTYTKDDRITHLAPYSFFADLSRGDTPMVAFSGYRKNGQIPKDAQKDTQESEMFAYNMVTEDTAVRMNLCAAPLERKESEFALAGLVADAGEVLDVPIVTEAPVRYECKYVKTVDLPEFSIVIGRVESVSVESSALTEGCVDVIKSKAITRLGFMDEYGILEPL